MQTDKLLEKIETTCAEFSDIESLIKIIKDSCTINDLYSQELALKIVCEKMNNAMDNLDELQSDIYRIIKQTQLQQFRECS